MNFGDFWLKQDQSNGIVHIVAGDGTHALCGASVQSDWVVRSLREVFDDNPSSCLDCENTDKMKGRVDSARN